MRRWSKFVTVETEGDWNERTRSHALAVEFSGPTLEASLTRAVEGFADALGDIHPSMATERHPFEARAATPSALLLAVLEECLRCRREGRFAVGLANPVVVDDVLTAGVDTVAADDPHVQPSLPPVISWHEVLLEPGPGGVWSGRIVAR
jgi:SHS2 domain-containing protein